MAFTQQLEERRWSEATAAGKWASFEEAAKSRLAKEGSDSPRLQRFRPPASLREALRAWRSDAGGTELAEVSEICSYRAPLDS